jgi:hypothetical protein
MVYCTSIDDAVLAITTNEEVAYSLPPSFFFVSFLPPRLPLSPLPHSPHLLFIVPFFPFFPSLSVDGWLLWHCLEEEREGEREREREERTIVVGRGCGM